MTQRKAMDGMEAAGHAAYALSDAAMIYPITPASHMAETIESWAATGKANLFGAPVEVTEMQSEKGVAGTVHGCLAGGVLTSTFTASQGLLLMIPNMYKIAGELLPGVFHVTCRSLSAHALSIFGDHQDIMAVRQTGFAMLGSASVQECMDLSLVAHLSAIEGSLPFVHFMDGFRTSDEIETIDVIDDETIRSMVDWQAIHRFRARCMDPLHPEVRGTAQNPDVYFQNREASNQRYDALPAIVQGYMDRVAQVTGRAYHLFDYVGDPEAERVIITMGSSCDVVEEAVEYLNRTGAKVGLIKVRLYRPFSAEALLAAIPPTAQTLCALDRTKEPGCFGEPLLQDVSTAVLASGRPLRVIGGRYGLSSKDFTPAMVAAVFDNMASDSMKTRFTVGIDDDMTHLSLPVGEPLDLLSSDVTQCMFYGFGSDGTVGANKQAAKIIGNDGGQYAQCYSWFDSKKSGGLTISYVRFSPRPIHSPYLIDHADYIACHKDIYVHRGYEMISALNDGGVFVLNASWSLEEMERQLPAYLKRGLATRHARFFAIDASGLAAQVGLGSRINMIMQTVFFKLSGVMDFDEAIEHLKQDIPVMYASQGDDVVQRNLKAVDATLDALREVSYPAAWADAKDEEPTAFDLAIGTAVRSSGGDGSQASERPYELTESYLDNIFRPLSELKGNDLPVSKLDPAGFVPLGTAAYEKRTVAFDVPEWDVQKCIQCFQCSMVCPHAAIRPYLATDEELSGAPESFQCKDPFLKPLKGLHFRIQVYPEDCVGCGSCADNCPAPGKALVMKPLATQLETQKVNLDFAQKSVSLKDDLMEKTSVAGTQLQKPLLEFSSACPGCGETPHVKLLTQLFGDRLIIANATGCTSIWGAYMPSVPYTVDRHGHGPAWGNSLFEDNGEYGFGIATAVRIRRESLIRLVNQALASDQTPEDIKEALTDWLNAKDDPDMSYTLGQGILSALSQWLQSHGAGEMTSHDAPSSSTADSNVKSGAPLDDGPSGKTDGAADPAGSGRESDLIPLFRAILRHGDMFQKKSIWAVGGDGWAYDIGFDGLDAVLAKGENINVLVLDTEGYSNTGGEESKATQLGSVSGFSLNGKPTPKKQLGRMMMAYGYVYVAQVCLGADMQQVITALREAEAYDGPSIVIALCPCISWGIKEGMGANIRECKAAVKAGYWSLFRFNPDLAAQGKDPFILDSKAPDGKMESFLDGENRFASLEARKPSLAQRLHSELAKDANREYEELVRTVDVYAPSE